MSKIDELIKEMCPNGVEYKKVGEIADVSIGLATSVTKYKRDSGVLLLHNSDIQQGRIELKNIEYIDDSFAKKNSSKLLRKNDIITVHTGDVGTSAVITDEYAGTIGFTTITSRIRDFNQVYPYYLCTYFNSHKCKMDIRKMTISDRSNLNQKDFIKIKIPIPPLPIQREIVRILDSFTELTEELTEELTARKKQYEFYRDELLTNENTTVLKPLGDICTLVRGPFGGSLKKECFVSDGYVVYEQQHAIYDNFSNFRYFIDGTKYEELKRFSVNPGDMIMSCSGTMGKIAIVPDDSPKGVINQALLKITVGPEVDKKYLKYCFENTVTKQMNDNARGGAIKNVASVAELKQTMIAVPPIETQKRLVKVLDNFDAICSDLNIGLPAEIEARQKQYEYYRDMLLTFAEKGEIIPNRQTDRQTDRQTSNN